MVRSSHRRLGVFSAALLAVLFGSLLGSLFCWPRAACAQVAAGVNGQRTLDDYRHFRALMIDLAGRAPRRDELAAFERRDFRWEGWIEKLLRGPGYVDRMVRIYMDLLRLEVGPAFNYAPPAATLRRQLVKGPGGAPLWVYYRVGQRRKRAATDGEFCLTEGETGLTFTEPETTTGTAHDVSAAVLEENTVVVKPWWLYRDFDAEAPSQWIPGVADPDPLFRLVDTFLEDAGGGPTMSVRVCREEAQTAEKGTIFAPVREPSITPIPPGRFRAYPGNEAYATAHKGEAIACHGIASLTMSAECGCGVGLRDCLPGAGPRIGVPRAFAVLPTQAPLGAGQPLASAPESTSAWYKFWWHEEASRFIGLVFEEDRDLRDLLTTRQGFVNGPLAAFYRAAAGGNCCKTELPFGMVQASEPLVDPRLLPDVAPWDTRTWKVVADRGPHAAGLITLPAFLAKFASRRARAAALYTTFTCKSFVAGPEPLAPSKEPDLTIRPGCSSCHATLEPLAAYFTRVEETSWTFLPAWRFPLRNTDCHRYPSAAMYGPCSTFYDPDFSSKTGGLLRGAHPSLEHAEAGPAGAAQALTESPEFATCAVQRITSSFLGRPLTSDDDPLVDQLTRTFRGAGLHPRALVRALVSSAAYRQATNVSSALWRGRQP